MNTPSNSGVKGPVKAEKIVKQGDCTEWIRKGSPKLGRGNVVQVEGGLWL